jgi:peptidoglycan/LPS O-acetylase OafA/YrhL
MAVGGVGAWLVFTQRQEILQVIFHRAFQLLLYAITIFLIVTERNKPSYNYLLYAVCFCLIIINVAANRKSVMRLENRLFVFLGNISFSIYMFHELVIKSVMEILVRWRGTVFNDVLSNVILYAASIVLTLVMSSIVYYFFEKPFLRLKSSFAVIESGQDLIEKGAMPAPA